MAMAACNQIIGYLDELLNPTAYDDYGPNGLQVPGSEQIQTVVTGASATADLFAPIQPLDGLAVRPLSAALYAD
jgi:putative NIF3 family GTP cyclohydrolase 1 type 2